MKASFKLSFVLLVVALLQTASSTPLTGGMTKFPPRPLDIVLIRLLPLCTIWLDGVALGRRRSDHLEERHVAFEKRHGASHDVILTDDETAALNKRLHWDEDYAPEVDSDALKKRLKSSVTDAELEGAA